MSLRQILKKRFGDTYTFAQRKLVIYLSVFSLSFLLRGIFDAVQKTKTINTNTVWSAVEVFVIYFFCEWLPIFVIYLHHHEDFKNEIKQLQT
jgi:O-antigen/teichoic acid export membrane protein